MDRDRLSALLETERPMHHQRNPASLAQFTGAEHLFTGVPMTWMANWAGSFPLALAGARGNRVTDVDGHTYVDFAIGDTGDTEIICCPPLADHALSDTEAHDLADVFAALSDPVRLRIFSIIASQDETCSCNLELPLAKSQPTISHHTRKLAAAGLIVGEKRGRWTWWRAVPEQLTALSAALLVSERADR